MKYIGKGLVFVLSIMIMLSLCLTPVVFATEGDNLPVPDSCATPSEATPPKDSGTPPPEQESATASTADELLDWLLENESVGGTITLTGDISLYNISYISDWDAQPITIDTGVFSISVSGSVELISNMLTIRGKGGERGVLRASEGGKLALSYLTVAADEGYVIFQEEGAGFAAEDCAITGEIHYADAPFIWSWKQGLAVVRPGGLAADALPDTLSVTINHDGATSGQAEIPVTWDLAGHEAAQENRQRFTAAGVFEGAASLTAPSCTVVYDDYPLTFLLVSGKKLPGGRGENYQFIGKFSMPEDRLPIIVAQEYSFDGENWLLCEEKDFPSPDIAFNMVIPGREWDTERNPAIFLRMRWDDAGTMYYSNVLRFAADNLAEGENHGGNRGGGTDITDPPTVPMPDPDPPRGDGSDGGSGSSDGNGLPNPTPAPPEDSEGNESAMPDPTPRPEPMLDRSPVPPITEMDTPGQSPTPATLSTPAPDIPVAGNAGSPTTPKAPQPTLENPAEVTPTSEPATTPTSTPEPQLKGPEAFPIAVGCVAVAGTIGAAGLYLHPQALKRMLELLRNVLPKK